MDGVEIIAAFRKRDPSAIQQLVESHGERLLRSASLLCGNETEAEDLVQATFLEALRSAPRFRGHSTLYTWLHAILLNLARHYHRDRHRLVYDDRFADAEPAAAEDPVTELDVETAGSVLAAAMKTLSPVHREVVVLRFYEHMKIGEIAAHLAISKGTVKSRLHYAVADLRRKVPSEMNLFDACGTKGVPIP